MSTNHATGCRATDSALDERFVQFSLRHEEDTLIVELQTPRLDSANAPALRGQLAELAQACGRSALALDLTKVRFVDSSGLALMVSIHRALAPGNRLRLRGELSRDVRTLLRLTRLEEVFDIRAETSRSRDPEAAHAGTAHGAHGACASAVAP